MAIVISSIGLKGIEGYKVYVEVQLIPGVEGMSIVGLPDISVKESKDRVLAALYACGCAIPDNKKHGDGPFASWLQKVRPHVLYSRLNTVQHSI